MGLSTDCRRAEGPWHRGLSDDRAHVAAGRGSWTGRARAGGSTWREFVRAHRHSLLAVDFFTVETMWLQRLYVLFFIELGSRRVHLAGCTPNPSAPWVIQHARQLSWTLAERSEPLRFLIRDRDQKFTDRFDDVFRSDGIEIVRTPFRAPQANGVAERFVRTVRSECLDWLLILNQQHLERILEVFVTTTTDTGHIEHCLSRHPSQDVRRSRRRLASSCSPSRSSRWCDSRVHLGGVTRFSHPTRQNSGKIGPPHGWTSASSPRMIDRRSMT